MSSLQLAHSPRTSIFLPLMVQTMVGDSGMPPRTRQHGGSSPPYHTWYTCEASASGSPVCHRTEPPWGRASPKLTGMSPVPKGSWGARGPQLRSQQSPQRLELGSAGWTGLLRGCLDLLRVFPSLHGLAALPQRHQQSPRDPRASGSSDAAQLVGLMCLGQSCEETPRRNRWK